MIKLINRPTYTERLKPFIDKNIIKVLTGQRRVGKSCVLLQIQEYIRSIDSNANIIAINKELDDFSFISTHDDLSTYVAKLLKEGCKNYLFIDEVQDITGFEMTLRSLQASGSCDIYVTGSNAMMLSSELSTYLSGRYIEIHVYSLSFGEFLTFNRLNPDNGSLRSYLTFGGMPYLSNLTLERDVVFEYLRNVYNTIILKDVVKRERIRNVDFLETLAQYTADNVGNLFSANNISRYLKSQRVNISPLQVINYLRALQNAFLIEKVKRVDVNGLRTFEIGDKFYFEDLGLRNCHFAFNMQRDISKLVENAVFLHLLQRHFNVYTGQQSGGREIDFVALRGDERIYVQAAYLITDDKAQQREFGNLKEIGDNYPKYVVSLDEWTSGSNVGGIKHVHLGDFLRNNLESI